MDGGGRALALIILLFTCCCCIPAVFFGIEPKINVKIDKNIEEVSASSPSNGREGTFNNPEFDSTPLAWISTPFATLDVAPTVTPAIALPTGIITDPCGNFYAAYQYSGIVDFGIPVAYGHVVDGQIVVHIYRYISESSPSEKEMGFYGDVERYDMATCSWYETRDGLAGEFARNISPLR